MEKGGNWCFTAKWGRVGRDNWCFTPSQQLRIYHGQAINPTNRFHMLRKNSVPKTRSEPRTANACEVRAFGTKCVCVWRVGGNVVRRNQDKLNELERLYSTISWCPGELWQKVHGRTCRTIKKGINMF